MDMFRQKRNLENIGIFFICNLNKGMFGAAHAIKRGSLRVRLSEGSEYQC